jgi:cold shock CspA family protein
MMATGTLVSWDGKCRYGFIKKDGTSIDIFAHRNDVKGDVEKLKQGQRVSFDEATDPQNGKACAQNIEPIKT